MHTRVKHAVARPDVNTAANVHDRCRYRVIGTDIATENTNATSETIKNKTKLSLKAPEIASRPPQFLFFIMSQDCHIFIEFWL